MPAETTIRIGAFALTLFVMGIAEYIYPKRPLSVGKTRRWTSNLAIAFLSIGTTRFILPILPTSAALYAQHNAIGLLQQADLPLFLNYTISILLLDLAIFGQHILFHRQRLLWRVHRMHHADVNIDASTGIRFHPVEILISTSLKILIVLLLGAPLFAVILFEVMLNACSIFNHANLRIPPKADAALRWVVVTPDTHRIHHSTNMHEANTNFGFSVIWWDKIFKTYKPKPELGHDQMNIGLNIFRSHRFGTIQKLLLIPFL